MEYCYEITFYWLGQTEWRHSQGLCGRQNCMFSGVVKQLPCSLAVTASRVPYSYPLKYLFTYNIFCITIFFHKKMPTLYAVWTS